MANFLPVTLNDEGFIRGAARIMYANITVGVPTQVDGLINASTYVAQTGWFDLGATKSGIQINYNATGEEGFEVDQVYGEIDALPNGWTMTVATALAEVTLDRLAFAWEQITVVAAQAVSYGPGGSTEKQTNFGLPQNYTKRKLAVLFQRPNGKIRAFVFRKTQRSTVDSPMNFSRTGEQQSIPVQFRCLPDLSIAEPTQRFCFVMDQN